MGGILTLSYKLSAAALLAVGLCAALPAAADTEPKTRSMLSILSLQGPDARTSDLTYGLSTGQGSAPGVPIPERLDRQTADAIIGAFKATTADQAARPAADAAATDPALEERTALAIAVFKVDGTDALIRHFVETEHMKLIIAEVARHIDFSKLSDSDKYRLAAIAASVQAELEDKIVRISAVQTAQLLSKPELLQLMAAFDTDAQRKLTAMRLNDDGKTDSLAELDIRLAQYQIVKQFESGQ